MMPSRGLPLARASAPRVWRQGQCRNLSSSAARLAPRLSKLSRLRPTPPQWPIRSALRLSTRDASTSTTTSPPSAPSSFPNLDTITLDTLPDPTTITPLTTHAPDTLGYLSSLGLNYHFGPTTLIEMLLEYIHVYTALPWGASIALTALVLRLATIPLYIKAADTNARTLALTPLTAPLTARISAARASGDQTAMMAAMQEQFALRKRAGVKFRHTFYPMLAQSVIGFCGFRLLRACVALPVPEFRDQGMLWLSDLTVPDPYALLPLAMAGCMHLVVRLGGESGSAGVETMGSGMKTFMLYGMPGVVLLIMGWQPGALCVWFAVSSAVGMGQAVLLQREGVRRWLGIAPLYRPTKEEAGPGLMGELFKPMGRSPSPSSPSAAEKAKAAATREQWEAHAKWQAPNLRTREVRPGGRVIDVKPVAQQNKAEVEAATQGEKMAEGGGIRAKVSGWTRLAKEAVGQRQEKSERERRREEDEAYERRWQRRRGTEEEKKGQ